MTLQPIGDDPAQSMSNADRQRLQDARTSPLPIQVDMHVTLDRFDRDVDTIERRLKQAREQHRLDCLLPDIVDDANRSAVEREAAARLHREELAARQELAIRLASVQRYHERLETLASTPDLGAVPDHLLEASSRYRPLLEAQTAGMDLTQLLQRCELAITRDDRAELLALSLIAAARVQEAERTPSDDPAGDDTLAAYELKAFSRSVAEWWQRPNPTYKTCVEVMDRLQQLDGKIIRDNGERTGQPAYAFLQGLAS